MSVIAYRGDIEGGGVYRRVSARAPCDGWGVKNECITKHNRIIYKQIKILTIMNIYIIFGIKISYITKG